MKGFILGAFSALGLVGVCNHLHKKCHLATLKIKGKVACVNDKKKTFYVHTFLEENISMRFFVTPATKIMFLETPPIKKEKYRDLQDEDNHDEGDDETSDDYDRTNDFRARFKDIVEGANVFVSFSKEAKTGKMIAKRVVVESLKV